MRDHRTRGVIAGDAPGAGENGVRRLEMWRDIEIADQVANGAAAIERAHQLHPDVVLMDINMPEMDGIAATKALSADLPDVAVVILSVHDELDVIRSAMLAGARGYLIKPPSADQLAETVREVYGMARHQRDLWIDQPFHDPGPAFRQPHVRRARNSRKAALAGQVLAEPVVQGVAHAVGCGA